MFQWALAKVGPKRVIKSLELPKGWPLGVLLL